MLMSCIMMIIEVGCRTAMTMERMQPGGGCCTCCKWWTLAMCWWSSPGGLEAGFWGLRASPTSTTPHACCCRSAAMLLPRARARSNGVVDPWRQTGNLPAARCPHSRFLADHTLLSLQSDMSKSCLIACHQSSRPYSILRC